MQNKEGRERERTHKWWVCIQWNKTKMNEWNGESGVGKCLLMFILFYSKGEWERKRDGERDLELFNKIIQCINNGLYSNNETKNGLGLVVLLLLLL